MDLATCLSPRLTYFPGSRQDWVNFGSNQEPEVILYHLMSLLGLGKGSLFQGEGVSSSWVLSVFRGFPWELFTSSLYPLPLLLLLFIFLSHCSSKLLSSQYVSLTFLCLQSSFPSHCRGKESGKGARAPWVGDSGECHS